MRNELSRRRLDGRPGARTILADHDGGSRSTRICSTCLRIDVSGGRDLSATDNSPFRQIRPISDVSKITVSQKY